MHALLSAGLLAGALGWTACGSGPDLSAAEPVGRPPRLDPDYTALVIPPNIAPLSFRILEEAERAIVRISPAAGAAVELSCPDGVCRPDPDDWRDLLDRSRGQALRYEVYATAAGGAWRRFEPFANTVAAEPIDPYIAFRQLAPNSQFTAIKGIFQRHLETYEREPIITLRGGTFECVNCHTFHQNNPDRFLFHVRRKHSGTVLVMDGQIRKVNTRHDPMFRPLAFASWHPDGRHVAATLNMYVGNSPSTVDGYHFQAFEKRGDLAVYDAVENTMSSTRAVFGDEYIETHPYCSPDGRFIYYVRGRDRPLISHRDLYDLEFDLMRIPYDVDGDVWGEPETVVAYSELGLSCAFPCPSPEGRYMLHILSDHGTYPVYQKSSDVYILDLESREFHKPAGVNSEFAESYPRWSSNGRWFSFVSSRRDGRSALPYFAYFDSSGRAHKAFVLPQRDPGHYDTFTDTYNVLELIRSRVDVDAFELARAMQQPAVDATFPAPPPVDAHTGATRQWLEETLPASPRTTPDSSSVAR